MDFGDDSPTTDVKGKKAKKSVVIDNKRDVKFIDVGSDKTKKTGSVFKNLDLYEWPWRVATSLFLIGYLFHVIAYATPYWMITSDNNGNDITKVGIWSACTTISNCTFVNDSPGQ